MNDTSQSNTPAEFTLMRSRELRSMLGGVSSTWIERRLKDDAAFPRPCKIRGQNFWRRSEVLNWVNEQIPK